MQPDFWRARWAQGQIGFHQASYNRHLSAFLEEGRPPGRVLVPLAGKTKDLTLLAEHGHEVVAVELVRDAAEAYFAEREIVPSRRDESGHLVLRGGGVEFHVCDIFRLGPEILEACDWAFDRAALVALPPSMRARYVPHLIGLLREGAHLLLVTFSYEQDRMSGPPFSVPDEEVRLQFEPFGNLELLSSMDVLPRAPGKFERAGLSSFMESVWRFERR